MILPADWRHWSRASAPILALVSGLPNDRRYRRSRLMLQAFIDESFDQSPPVYAMGGFIAPAEKWAAFSDAWGEVLSMRPRISHLKMNDAMTLDGEFRWWREEARDEKIRLLMGVIADHANAAICCALRHDEYAEVFGTPDVPKRYRSPYYFLLFGIIGEMARRQHEIGITEKVNFIFDEQVMEKGKIIEDWETFKRAAGTKVERDLIGDTPSFKDDQIVLPLQAADMIAWLVRTNTQRTIRGQDPIRLPPRISGAPDIPTLAFVWSKESFQSMRRDMETMKARFSGVYGAQRFEIY